MGVWRVEGRRSGKRFDGMGLFADFLFAVNEASLDVFKVEADVLALHRMR